MVTQDKYAVVFVYGTLKNIHVQKEVLGRALDSTPDTLPGYRRVLVELSGSLYPYIVPDEKQHVKGLVLHASIEELQLLDKHEDDVYERKRVMLASGIHAWAYVLDPKKAQKLGIRIDGDSTQQDF